MTSTSRRASAMTVAVMLLVLAQVFVVASPGYAFDPGDALPSSVKGGSASFGGKVVGKTAGRLIPGVGLGLLAWEGYQFYVDQTALDISGAASGGCHPAPFTDFTDGVCTELLGSQGGNWVVEGSGTLTNTRDQAIDVSVSIYWHAVGYLETCTFGLPKITGIAPGQTVSFSDVDPSGASGNNCYQDGSSKSWKQESTPVAPKEILLIHYVSGSTTQLGNVRLSWTDDVASVDQQPAEYTVTTRLDCYDPGTDTTSSVLVDQNVFVTEDGAFPSAPATCPAGTIIANGSVSAAPAPGTTAPDVDLFEWEQDPDLLVPGHQWADCLYPSAEPCDLYVERTEDFTVQDPEWERCQWQLENCTTWWWDADRDLRYRCMWGTNVLPADECQELAYAYRPDTPGQIVQNPALQPPTSPTQTPVITDPSTPSGDPSPPPVTPPEAVTQLPEIEQGEQHGDTSCFSGMEIGWNPVSWVLEPVKCALVWAFVPSAATMTSVQSVGSDFSGRTPVAQITGTADWFQNYAAVGNSCLLIEVPIMEQNYPVIDACTPGPVAGQIMGYRTLLAVAVWGSFLLPLAWWAWRQYAPGAGGSA